MKIFSENIWQSVLLVWICALTSLDLCVCVGGGGIALSIALDKRRGFFYFVFQPGIKNIMIHLMWCSLEQGLHRLEKYLNLEGFREKSFNIKSAFKSTGKSH